MALKESLRLEWNLSAYEFLKYLDEDATAPEKGSFSFWRLANVAPSCLAVAAAAAIAFVLLTRPTGYREVYVPPRLIVTDAAKMRSPTEEKANVLVGQLARIITDHTPVVGSHLEGSRVINEHVLDRSKFDPGQLMSLANQIGALQQSGAPDKDGFIASAYFNAQIFALSVYVVNGVTSGGDVRSFVTQVKELGRAPSVSGWLMASKFLEPYSALLIPA